ncbi:hypothetical protein QIU18_11135 [Capnocytophaga canimorsus]|nr:hypothetical protein [Capnocytophaga canimorsus]WGU68830.1 hypothetical protein QIU19_02490 [Capnocytophaga canimorsus]WGU70064.1 hypothetical protein QIU18_11135 [Capnocytophaga canimorsus]
MRAREIDAIIKEQTEAFFKQEGFKYVKKRYGVCKKRPMLIVLNTVLYIMSITLNINTLSRFLYN